MPSTHHEWVGLAVLGHADVLPSLIINIIIINASSIIRLLVVTRASWQRHRLIRAPWGLVGMLLSGCVQSLPHSARHPSVQVHAEAPELAKRLRRSLTDSKHRWTTTNRAQTVVCAIKCRCSAFLYILPFL